MATTKLEGNEVKTVGQLPEKGTKAPAFTLVDTELGQVSSADFEGKNLVLNVFPSVDTGVCAASVRKFNEEAAGLENTVVLCVSKDLPFALGRFCAAEGLDRVIPASAFRDSFGEDYGLTMADGPLAGLLARAVIILNPAGEVIYSQLVDEIKTEPDYQVALAAL